MGSLLTCKKHTKKLKEGGFLIAKIHQLASRIFDKLLRKNNINEINTAQGRILFVLWQNDGISISELSKKTQLEKSTLTNMLDHLEKDGYLIRIPSKDDRRKLIIKRTAKDKNLQNLYSKVSHEMTDIFYKDFSNKEIGQFENYLKKILNNLVLSDSKKFNNSGRKIRKQNSA